MFRVCETFCVSLQFWPDELQRRLADEEAASLELGASSSKEALVPVASAYLEVDNLPRKKKQGLLQGQKKDA